MSRPIQVVQIVSRMDRGGAESWLMNVWRRIDRARFAFTFCTMNGEPGVFDAEIRSLGGRVVPCTLDAARRPFAEGLTTVLQDVRCDVVHCHLLFFAGRVLPLANRAGVATRIAHSHTTQDGRPNGLLRRAYRWRMRRTIRSHATHGIGCSAAAADYLFTADWRGRPGYSVIPCGIDPAAFRETVDQTELRETLDIPADATVVGHVGSFRPPKNHSFLLRVVAAMIRKAPRIHLVLVGDGPLRPEMEKLANELAIGRNTHFVGVRGDVPVLMKNLFELFLFPSLYEGLPLGLVEAQCAGLPSLTSNAVTEEVVVVDGLVQRMPLALGPELWADRALEILDGQRAEPVVAMRAIEAGPFNIESSVTSLSELYAGRSPSSTS